MATTEVVCPICGARLVLEPPLPNATADGVTGIRRCENQHWWFRSPLFGWILIDPKATAMDEATIEPRATKDKGLL